MLSRLSRVLPSFLFRRAVVFFMFACWLLTFFDSRPILLKAAEGPRVPFFLPAFVIHQQDNQWGPLFCLLSAHPAHRLVLSCPVLSRAPCPPLSPFALQAQRLLFSKSTAGDLRPFLSAYFDTSVGGKKDASSYRHDHDGGGLCVL